MGSIASDKETASRLTMNLHFGNFPQLLVPFAASHFAAARTIWINKEFPEHFGSYAAANDERFVKNFSYLVPGGVTFDNLVLSDWNTAILHAERYGGNGIGENGGGARCGNIAGLQVKGVGKNVLAGCRDIHHSYGGFKAAYAVHEAIYSSILSKVLPLGVAGVHGVILTGSDAAYVSGMQRGWGGLLVRQQSLRPANFLRASFFSPPAEVAERLLSDVGRVRGVNKQLMRGAGDVSQVVRLFCRFLANAADQFAFARLAGIMHGAVTPSNQCLDGRWIDLTNTSFVSPSENYAGGNRETAAFHEEVYEPISIGVALVAQFSKFNCHQISIKPFVDYYRECLNQRLSVHLDYVCGLPRGSFARSHGHSFLRSLLQELLSKISGGPVIYDRWPTDPPKGEAIFEIMANLFVSASSERLPQVNSLNPSSFAETWAPSFRQLLLEIKPTLAGVDLTPHLFLVGSAIAAAKRLLLTPFFYKGRLEKIVCDMLENDQIDQLESYIPTVVDASKWILNLEIERDIAVVELPCLVLSFDLLTGVYIAKINARNLIAFNDPLTLLVWCDNQNPRLFEMDGFNFLPYVHRILNIIHAMNAVSNHAGR